MSAQDAMEDVRVEHWSWVARAAAGLVAPGGRGALELALDGLEVDEGSRVLEIQPGVGITSRRILDRNPRTWIGVDSDPLAASLLAGQLGAAGRTVHVGTPNATGVAAESVTAVVMEGVLATLDDSDAVAVVAECGRVLVRSGRMAAVELSLGPEAGPQVEEELTSAGLRVRDAADLRAVVVRAGLDVVGTVTTRLQPASPQELARAAGPRMADPRNMLGVARAVTDGAVRSAATVGRQALERHAINLRVTVVVGQRPLVAGLARRPV